MKFSRVCTSCLLGYKDPLSLANGHSYLTPLAVLPNTGLRPSFKNLLWLLLKKANKLESRLPGGCYKQCCDEHWGTPVSFSSGFLGVYAQEWDCWVIWQF